jgi:hypothetical protein
MATILSYKFPKIIENLRSDGIAATLTISHDGETYKLDNVTWSANAAEKCQASILPYTKGNLPEILLGT